MITFRHIGTFFALTWLISLISAKDFYYSIVTLDTRRAISVTSQNGVLTTVPAPGELSPNEGFKFFHGPGNLPYFESIKYPGYYINCNDRARACELRQSGTGFSPMYRWNGTSIWDSTGLRLTVTSEKEGGIFLKNYDDSLSQNFFMQRIA